MQLVTIECLDVEASLRQQLADVTDAGLAAVALRDKRIAELEAALRSVFGEWEPTRDDYRADRKGQRQFEQARDAYSAAKAVLENS